MHEIKFDGYRILCIIGDNVKLITRNQNDWTDKLPTLKKEISKLKLKNTIIDGELVALDQHHRSNFQQLQNSLREGKEATLYYYVFDIPYYKGYDLSSVDLVKRKEILKKLLSSYNGDFIFYSDHVVGYGDKVYKEACRHQLEGIISKHKESHYIQKRAKSWQKIKCSQRQEFVVGGYTKGRGARKHLGALMLGYYNKKKQFIFCGHVGTGFNQRSLQEMVEQLTKLHIKKCPFDETPPHKDLISWVKPKIIVEVEFTEWTDEGILRHPSLKGWGR